MHFLIARRRRRKTQVFGVKRNSTRKTGLFKVTDGVYQVRGFSVSNMTIVEGRTGIILIDTLFTPGAAREALNLYFAHRPRKPIVAVIYTTVTPITLEAQAVWCRWRTQLPEE